MNYITKPAFALIIFLCFSFFSPAQEDFNDHARAMYIIELSRNVTWPVQYQDAAFSIGIIDNDSALYHEVTSLSGEKIHGQPVSVMLFHDIAEIMPTHVLYVHKKDVSDLRILVQKITGKGTLLISENYEFHQSMINFLVVNNRRRFEINRTLLQQEGFVMNPGFSEFAVETRADWEKLYRQTETLLDEEKKVVERQNEEIVLQNEQISRQDKLIMQQEEEMVAQKKAIEEQKKLLSVLGEEIQSKQNILEQQEKRAEIQEKSIQAKQQEIIRQNELIGIKKTEITGKQKKIKNLEAIHTMLLKEIEAQKLIIILAVVLLLLISGIVFVIYRSYKIKKRVNRQLEEKNIHIMQQKEEIEAQRDEIEAQKTHIEVQRDLATSQRDEIAMQKQEITDSIHYAHRIQTAILPPQEQINHIMPHRFFILNMPKDIVSGDYYWITRKDDYVIFLVADCTGHGVPGAFMSMLGVAFLHQIVNRLPEPKANIILNLLRDQIIQALHQTGREGEAQDGMDIALCILNTHNNILQFSGANNPLYLIRNRELTEIHPNRMPIGIYHLDEQQSFTNHEIQLQQHDALYIFSDGIADQYGGPQHKKFKYRQLKELLTGLQHIDIADQAACLEKIIVEWRGEIEQMDDILMMGVKIS